ncbi:MAG TPA: GGDEF domain-containing response regulator [Candidatus Binatia bacterium]|nr:GGDEF domain-containing response regulator [Candidatus Binatia bacterium]
MLILLIEDSPADAKIVQIMLESSDLKDDARLIHVESLAAAKADLKKHTFDVILLDLGLPDASGLEPVIKLRAETTTPIVVLSGAGDEAIATMAVREGAQDYLVKGHVDEFLLSRALRYAIERGEDVKRMSTLAFYDALTGLQNRQSLMLSFEQALGRAQRDHSPVACMFVDLDHFKEVNDTLGHHAGDQVLMVVAQILRDAVRGSDIVARMGGDEFVIVLSSIKKPADAAVVAEKILRHVNRAIEVEGKPAHVTASIGITFYPEDAQDQATLIDLADQTMYEAKKAGKNRCAVRAEHPARRGA